MTPPTRVLVTGSRDWESYHWLAHSLRTVLEHAGPFTLVHGACPRGADQMASEWAGIFADHGITEERHPADWDTHGKQAGYQRNAHMVSLGADLCLAFQMPCTMGARCPRTRPHASHGTAHCADLAEKAGILTQRFDGRAR
jgi:hypothetical protein